MIKKLLSKRKHICKRCGAPLDSETGECYHCVPIVSYQEIHRFDGLKTAIGVLSVFVYGSAMVIGLFRIFEVLQAMPGILGTIGTVITLVLALGLFAILYWLFSKHEGIW